MNLREQIPNTKQGILTFQRYCNSRLEEIKREKKRLFKQLEICTKKLEKFKGDGK